MGQEGATAQPRSATVAELGLLEHVGQLCAAGWRLEPAEAAGRLCVSRYWDGKVFGRKSVQVDELAIRRDGLAEAVRRDKHDQRSLMERGPVAEVVAACLNMSAPGDHTLQTGVRRLPLDTDTARVEVFFHLRTGWECFNSDQTGLMYAFCLGVASEQWERPRLEQHEDLGLEPLCCTVTPELDVHLIPWHVHNGCSEHRRGEIETVPFDDPALLQILDQQETRARDVDLRELAYCLAFGPCSLRDRTDRDDEDRVRTALTQLDEGQWVIRSGGEQHIANRRWPDGSIDLITLSSAHRAYGIRVDSAGWVVWKQVGLVETVTEHANNLAPGGDAGAPTERLYRMHDDERSLIITDHQPAHAAAAS